MIKSFDRQIRPVILGKVKIGKWIKGKSGQKFDHFKIVRVGRTSEGDIIEDIETTNHIAAIQDLNKGAKLTRIPIYFSGNTKEDVFDSWYSLRWGSKTLCMGDGITAQRANISVNDGPLQNGALKITKGDDVKIHGHVTIPCADSAKGCLYYNPKPDQKSSCLIGSKLLFHIQGLTRRGGFFQFTNHSIHTTKNLYFGLCQFEKMLCGHLSFLPFDLVLEEQRNQLNQLIYVVHLEMVGELPELRAKAIEAATVEMQFMKQMKQIRMEGVKLLEMKSEEENDDEGEKETQEYFDNETIEVAKPVEIEIDKKEEPKVEGFTTEENDNEDTTVEEESLKDVTNLEVIEEHKEEKPEIVKRTVTRKKQPPSGMLF